VCEPGGRRHHLAVLRGTHPSLPRFPRRFGTSTRKLVLVDACTVGQGGACRDRGAREKESPYVASHFFEQIKGTRVRGRAKIQQRALHTAQYSLSYCSYRSTRTHRTGEGVMMLTAQGRRHNEVLINSVARAKRRGGGAGGRPGTS
jgi:hypothetical protein